MWMFPKIKCTNGAVVRSRKILSFAQETLKNTKTIQVYIALPPIVLICRIVYPLLR